MIKKSLLICSACLLFSGQAFAVETADLAGKWQLKASPIGVTGDDGISTTGWDYIDFTATASTDGNTLLCHADNFVTRNGQAYPMDWKLAVEHDGDKVRLGWVLDAQQPASTLEFQQPATAYAIGGMNPVEGEHRYIYLLTYDIDQGQEGALTLWSSWIESPTADASYVFPQNYQLDAVVSKTIPYGSMVGYVDSWASASITKSSDTAVGAVTVQTAPSNCIYNLQGVRLNSLQKGINIVNGKKVVMK